VVLPPQLYNTCTKLSISTMADFGSLPQDHDAQLELAQTMMKNAHAGNKTKFESEIRALKLQVEEQRMNISSLQKKNSSLEVELVESHQRSQQLAEENKELFKTVGSLRKQIGRLEHLKAAVLSSIQDDAEKEAEIGETRGFMTDEYLQQATPLTSQSLGLGGPRQPPTPTYQTNVGGASPAPPADGKAFFRQARSRLAQDSFNQFLASIKRLNNQQQTREDTLAEARQLFGPQNEDLYYAFENLLNTQGVA